jgi:hypothetical protein
MCPYWTNFPGLDSFLAYFGEYLYSGAYSPVLARAVIRRPIRKWQNFYHFFMLCATFQDGSNWSILEGVCEPQSTPSSVKIASFRATGAKNSSKTKRHPS